MRTLVLVHEFSRGNTVMPVAGLEKCGLWDSPKSVTFSTWAMLSH